MYNGIDCAKEVQDSSKYKGLGQFLSLDNLLQ